MITPINASNNENYDFKIYKKDKKIVENKKITINSKKPLELPNDLAKDIFQKEVSNKKEAKKKADTTNIWTYYDQVYWGM